MPTDIWSLHRGEALIWLRTLPNGHADALVTDPPAGIAFMGKGWDRDKGGRTAWVAWLAEILSEARRCLKPGAAGFVWALPRTSHWTATACEDAGFEVRDVVTHVQGQGFPKSKALLKPAAEHWILVRNPGPLRDLRIDECRVGTELITAHGGGVNTPGRRAYGGGSGIPAVAAGSNPHHGRWPANFAMSHSDGCADTCEADCPVRLLGEQSGVSRGPKPHIRATDSKHLYGRGFGEGREGTVKNNIPDTGTAARFFPCFYQPKASKRDRGEDNTHTTVKSTALMRWLCRLVTPAGGLVLDPFAGSGTTGVAALQEGLRFVGIEKEEEYAEIARRRIGAIATSRSIACVEPSDEV